MSEEMAPTGGTLSASRRTSARARTRSDHAARVPHDGRCAYCGRAFGSLVRWEGKGRFLGLTFDHVFPVAAGGLNDRNNSVACCAVCNSIKGALVFESFAAARLYVLSELERRDVILLKEATPKPCPARVCERCKTEFISAYSRARFCSNKCRQKTWDDEHPRIEWRGAPRSPANLARDAHRAYLRKARPGDFLCGREGCMNRAVWRGPSRGYCSWGCRSAIFDHPERKRQLPIRFSPPAEPLIQPRDQRVRARRRAFSRQARRILTRLEAGPVANVELALMFPPATAWRSRLSDVRWHLRKLWGLPDEAQPLGHHDCGGGIVWHWLEGAQ